MEQITYGFYKTSDDALTLGDKLPQKGSTVTDTIGAEFEPTEWRKASMLFTTGADVENVVFGYTYRDIDESGTINKATLYIDDLVIMDECKTIPNSNIALILKYLIFLFFR